MTVHSGSDVPLAIGGEDVVVVDRGQSIGGYRAQTPGAAEIHPKQHAIPVDHQVPAVGMELRGLDQTVGAAQDECGRSGLDVEHTQVGSLRRK
ncbi:hypothetical protein [Kibdelosporangium aridum]|uniref:hypothetical protein n=1 Tax=Kibdelosporangium aridum TaxID=2030 RepID=UPI0035EBF4B5